MSPPEQSNKSKDKILSDISKSLISVEYKGRRAVIRRSAHYDVTISSVKKAFNDLRNVSNDDIVISAFLKEFDNTMEVPLPGVQAFVTKSGIPPTWTNLKWAWVELVPERLVHFGM
ncbi:hypothetical protein FRC12_017048 [Ceratobasidium sp. 428]|nr:hypothetical protein FRC12_017048 [Ceratobasidium sp. 428]